MLNKKRLNCTVLAGPILSPLMRFEMQNQEIQDFGAAEEAKRKSEERIALPSQYQ